MKFVPLLFVSSLHSVFCESIASHPVARTLVSDSLAIPAVRHDDILHRTLSSALSYEALCDNFQQTYGTCACNSNPDAALGVVSTTAFISCTPPNMVVDANFTSNDRYLSSLSYCNDLKDTCFHVQFDADGAVTECSVDYVVVGAPPSPCASCSPCALNGTTGFSIDCDNVFPEASTNECAAPETLLEFDPSMLSAAPTVASSWLWTNGLGTITALILTVFF